VAVAKLGGKQKIKMAFPQFAELWKLIDLLVRKDFRQANLGLFLGLTFQDSILFSMPDFYSILNPQFSFTMRMDYETFGLTE
jgi:hypothetical protein